MSFFFMSICFFIWPNGKIVMKWRYLFNLIRYLFFLRYIFTHILTYLPLDNLVKPSILMEAFPNQLQKIFTIVVFIWKPTSKLKWLVCELI